MPLVPLGSLPDDARVWVFAAERALAPAEAEAVLGTVDAFLGVWAAHGHPLRSARELRESRFLIIAAYRPSEMMLARQPFLAVKLELQSQGVFRELRLDFLSRDDVQRYLTLEFPEHTLPDAFGKGSEESWRYPYNFAGSSGFGAKPP